MTRSDPRGDDLDAIIASLDDEYLECRDLKHAWSVVTARSRSFVDEDSGRVHVPEFGVYRVLRCARCRALRFETIAVTGEVVARRYETPDGYRIIGFGDETRPSAQYRAETIRRLREEANQETA